MKKLGRPWGDEPTVVYAQRIKRSVSVSIDKKARKLKMLPSHYTRALILKGHEMNLLGAGRVEDEKS